MKRLIVLLVAVAAAVALAGLYLPADAATVGGSSITRQALDSDLSAIARSPDYTCFLSEERQLSSLPELPFLGAGTASPKGGVYDATFVDDWLGSMITDQVAARTVAEKGLAVTSADMAVARGVLTRRITDVLDEYARDADAPEPSCGGDGTAVLTSLPGWFTSEQVGAEADQAVLDARAAHSGLKSQEVAAYFSAHRRAFDKDCLDIIVVHTRTDAGQVETALRHGTSFSSEAAATSITTGTASSGGSAGCVVLAGTFLATGVGALSVGRVSKPFSGDGVYWIVKLTSRSTVALSSVRTTVVTTILSAGQQHADAELTSNLSRSTITVDPRYGSPAKHRLTLVLPPPAPPASAELSTKANLPALTAASS